VTGYMSVRTPATREQIDAAASHYSEINEKRAAYVSTSSATQEIGKGMFKLKSILVSILLQMLMLLGGAALSISLDGPKIVSFVLLALSVLLLFITGWALNENLFKPLKDDQ
jgi:hypothetical protein